MTKLSWEEMSEYLDIVLEMETSVYMQKQLIDSINSKINRGQILTSYGILSREYPELRNIPLGPGPLSYNGSKYTKSQKVEMSKFSQSQDKLRCLQVLSNEVSEARNYTFIDIKPSKVTNLAYVYNLRDYYTGRRVFSVIANYALFIVTKRDSIIWLDNNKFLSESAANIEAKRILGEVKKVLSSMIEIVEKYINNQHRQIEISSSTVLAPYNNNLKITENNLNKLYDANIIFPKYRNIVAVASFNEYWQTGRVSELAGPNGAYNLYENETRMDQIITRMDTIIKKLDQIKNSQYMLYTAINDTNKLLKGITSKLDAMSNDIGDMSSNMNTKLNAIINNTAMTAINTKITADNTRAIKYMTLYNTLFR